ncbi:MAG: hypothetical protein QOH64_1459 [Acidimicrobiaceae bacterium]
MDNHRSGRSRRLAAIALACVLALGSVAPRAAAAFTSACAGASADPGAFADAGPAADCLKAYGISLGKGDGTFGENDPLLRSQVSSLLVRFVQLAGGTFGTQRVFRDVNADTVPNMQVRNEINELAGSGIIAGFTDGTFRPALDLTVAQAATLVVRALAYLHSTNPSAPDLRDQGSTSADYDYAIANGILDRSAADMSGQEYPDTATSGARRGMLGDMLAQAVQKVVDAGVVRSRGGTTVFGDGQYAVGSQLPAGTYRTTHSMSCHWARQNGIADSYGHGGPMIVTVHASDAGFTSESCVQWSNDLYAMKSPADPIPPGVWQVGAEVAPGTYHASPLSSSRPCFWERDSGFGGTTNEIIDNNMSAAEASITIAASDAGFNTDGCTSWVPG